MKYFSAARQAHGQLAGEATYRELADKATVLQSEAVAALAAVRAELAEIKVRLASVEKILKEVE